MALLHILVRMICLLFNLLFSLFFDLSTLQPFNLISLLIIKHFYKIYCWYKFTCGVQILYLLISKWPNLGFCGFSALWKIVKLKIFRLRMFKISLLRLLYELFTKNLVVSIAIHCVTNVYMGFLWIWGFVDMWINSICVNPFR